MFEKTMIENFPNLFQNINLHVQEAWETPEVEI
jgi:hypothetical protein